VFRAALTGAAVAYLALVAPARAVTCSTLLLPSGDLGARIEALGACLNELSDEIKQECSKPMDNYVAGLTAAVGEQDQDKKAKLEKWLLKAEAEIESNRHRCDEMYHDFMIAKTRFDHDMKLSDAESEDVKQYDQRRRQNDGE
jgi:hypothetical protein